MAERLMEVLTAHGPETPVDMDLMCAKLSWDVIGKLLSTYAVFYFVPRNFPRRQYCCLAYNQFQELEASACRLLPFVCYVVPIISKHNSQHNNKSPSCTCNLGCQCNQQQPRLDVGVRLQA